MTLEKAIRINEDNEALQREDGFEESAKATQLGIEALKRLQKQRRLASGPWDEPLPGETKE